MKSNKLLVMLPIFIAIALAVGVYLGKNMGGQVQPLLFNNAEFETNWLRRPLARFV